MKESDIYSNLQYVFSTIIIIMAAIGIVIEINKKGRKAIGITGYLFIFFVLANTFVTCKTKESENKQKLTDDSNKKEHNDSLIGVLNKKDIEISTTVSKIDSELKLYGLTLKNNSIVPLNVTSYGQKGGQTAGSIINHNK